MIPVLDLLVIGGVSIDRYPDGSTFAGGTVLHATRAARDDGWAVASIVLAGPEPEAAGALAELHDAGLCRLHDTEQSARFRIDERGARRWLVLEARTGLLQLDATAVGTFGAQAVLFGPIAGEIEVASLVVDPPTVRVAALQGWLRELRVGQAVRARSLSHLPPALVTALGGFDALIVSTEDLGTRLAEPLVALAALRRTFGPRPLLVVTAGEAGAWLDVHASARLHVDPPRVIRGVSTVGAGDAFAGLLTAGLGRRINPEVAAERAALGVADLLAARAR